MTEDLLRKAAMPAGALPASTESTPPPLRDWCFAVRTDESATMDDLVDAVFDVVGPGKVYGISHRGGNLYHVAVTTRSAVDRVFENGIFVAEQRCHIEPLGVRTVNVTCKMVPLYLRNENLIRALNKHGKVLKLDDITFEDRKGRGTLRTGNKKALMEINDKCPLPNFIRVMDALIQCDYPGVRRVCRRCKQEGHLRANCKTPFCERCSSFGHTTNDCGSRCRRCHSKHPQGDCPSRLSYAAATRCHPNFPDLPPAHGSNEQRKHSEVNTATAPSIEAQVVTVVDLRHDHTP